MTQANSRSSIKVAYGSVPKDGGTFTFYRNQRAALREHGVELICVSIGRQQAQLIEGSAIDAGCVLLAADTDNVRRQAQAFCDWCVEQDIDVVMAINSIPILSALPHLPATIRVVARCANGFDEGYRITLSGEERLQHIVALTPRLADDLVSQYGANPERMTLIPNGIDPEPFPSPDQERGRKPGMPLRLGFLGRLEHGQKGVLHLPAVVRHLVEQGVDFHLRIAGKGRHGTQLSHELKPFIDAGRVELLGDLTRDQVPGFLSSLDVYLFTSHFEGCPNSLLEAMMAGAAPIAFQIAGTVDFIIEHNRSGLIVPQGNSEAMARAVAELGQQDDRLADLQANAASTARARFTPDRTARAYAMVFEQVMASPAPAVTPRPWRSFRIDSNYRPGWKALVPAPVKNLVKRARARSA